MNSSEQSVRDSDIIDLEACAERGEDPPAADRYRIRIDKDHFVVEEQTMTGRELLELAGKTPPERWMLNQQLRGGNVEDVGLDETVDFTTPGIERFMTLPRDQYEG